MSDDEAEVDKESLPSFREGYWIWDDYTSGLLFIRGYMEKAKRQSSTQPLANDSISCLAEKKDTSFKHTFGSKAIARFKKLCERKIKPGDVNVVLLQDCKDVALYSCDINLLSPGFIKMFHSKSIDKLLRALIVFFQYYLQIWNELQIRRQEAGRKLRQPSVEEAENILRDNLADLRSIVAREHAAIIAGMGDAEKFHHMKSENNLALSEKDRNRFELLVKISARVVWIALKRKNLALIEKEIHRLLRTKHFSPMEHDLLRHDLYVSLPEEDRILIGKTCQDEQKLHHRSPLIQELVLETHDYRLLSLGVTGIEDRNHRLDYLEIALTAPEELLEELNVGVGLLGVPKRYLDPLLNQEFELTKKRTSSLKPIPDLVIPPFIPYDHTKISDELPKLPCRYQESKMATNARQVQCKMWMEYIKRRQRRGYGSISQPGSQSTPGSVMTGRASGIRKKNYGSSASKSSGTGHFASVASKSTGTKDRGSGATQSTETKPPVFISKKSVQSNKN